MGRTPPTVGSSFPRQVRRSDPPLRVPDLVPSVMDYTWKYKLKQTSSTSRLLLCVVVLNTASKANYNTLGANSTTPSHTHTRTAGICPKISVLECSDQPKPEPTGHPRQQACSGCLPMESTLTKQGAPELHPKAAPARSLRKARFRRRLHQKRTVSCT